MIIITSDWHLQTSGMFAQPTANGLTSRAQEGLDFIYWLADQYITPGNRDKKALSAIVHCGDMFTQKTGISTALYNTALDALRYLTEKTGLDFYYLPGNHDMLMKTGAKHHNMYAIAQAVERVHVIDETGALLDDLGTKVEVVGVQPPFTEHKLDPKTTTRRLLVIHENVIGGRYESGTLIDKGVPQGDIRKYAQKHKVDIVFGGDIHEPQKIAGKPTICLVGAPMKFNFGDTKDRGFWVYEAATNDSVFVKYPAGPDYVTINDKTIKDSHIFKPTNYYRFRVSQPGNLEAARKIAGKSKNVLVEYDPPKRESEGAVEFTSPEKMVEPYVETFAETHNDDERAALVALGHELMRAVDE